MYVVMNILGNILHWSTACAKSKPTMIIANTIKGKGVSYMEGNWKYHTIIPSSQKDIEIGLEELS